MGYKLSYGLYIGKWVYPSHETLTIYPSHETLTIYPQPGSSLCSLLTRPLLYTLLTVPYCVPFSRFLTVFPSHGSLLYTLNVVPHYVPFSRDPNYIPFTRDPNYVPFSRDPYYVPFSRDPYYIPSTWFLTMFPSHETPNPRP